MKMKKKSFLTLSVLSMGLFLAACGGSKKEKVVILSSGFDYENEFYLEKLNEKFPDYDIVLEYIGTGNHAAKLKAEGTNSEADISIDLEAEYIEMIKDDLADLSEYDYSVFEDDVVPEDKKYLPALRNSGAIILNMDVLEEKNLEEPTSYEDLLKPEYKDLISMPDAKASGTGYVFLKSLVNAWGEDEAFEYFDKLSPNVLQFTPSGTTPVNSLAQGEVAIGFGIISQAVESINKGVNLKIVSFEEGAPYNIYGHSIIKGKETREPVKEVFDYFYDELMEENNVRFYPEPLYKGKTSDIENYPEDIKYANMEGNSAEEKERLLAKWNH